MIEFVQNPYVQIAFALLASGLIIIFVVRVWPTLRDKEQGYPLEYQIELLLQEYVVQAIIFAYRASEWAIDDSQERLAGVDKKAVADKMYDMLPERIGGFDVSFVKHLISRERFSELVQVAYDEMMTRFNRERQIFFELLRDKIIEVSPPES